MAGELKFNEVGAPSTPAAGKEALFVLNSTPGRLVRLDSAGTSWYEAEHFVLTNTADHTLTNNGNAEFALAGSAAGQITLPASMSYYFDFVYLVTNTGTTSHTWATLFGGTATLTSIGYFLEAYTATSNAITAVSGIYATAATALVGTAASTSATENVILKGSGVIRINGAGTLIPQIKPSAATTGTAKTLANSYFRMAPFGSDTAGFLGAWT